MSRKVLGVWLVSIVVLMGFGNACSRNFQFSNDDDLDLQSMCRQDETHLSGYRQDDYRVGYIGQSKVHYIPQEDDWILVDGDRLLKVKGGILPSQPLPGSQGVGVPASGRWKDGVIPYEIDPTLPDKQRVTDAITHWNQNLSGVISLIPRTTQSDYLRFTKVNSGCSAPVGFLAGDGIHPVNVGPDCGAGNVAHEIGHIVGLDHEQNRLDRNNYVTINYSNIAPAYKLNFEIVDGYQNYNFYDFGSIMHYTRNAFASDFVSDTITPKVAVPAGITIGQRLGLSLGDINSVRIMYGYAPISDGGTAPTLDPSRGLFARYAEGTDFRDVRVEKIEPYINFNWGASAPVAGVSTDNFSVRYTGFLIPPTDGVYVFRVQGMDPLKISIESEPIFLMKGENAIREAHSIGYELTKGYHYPIVIEYSALVGQSYLKLFWTKPDGTEEIIPNSAFRPNTDFSSVSPCSAQWLTEE
ncbi:MAG: hypothetical protein KF767_11980 [Bdellovibrionaceae bacterium]|nr:hypothetical protein [Pseudobdellovibrionaceae bacterium]